MLSQSFFNVGMQRGHYREDASQTTYRYARSSPAAVLAVFRIRQREFMAL